MSTNLSIFREIKQNSTFNKNLDSCISSRLVAQIFNKRHSDIIRMVDNFFNNIPTFNQRSTALVKIFLESNFEVVNYIDKKGEKRKEYQITKNGFNFLTQKFKGNEYDILIIQFIEAFDKLEKEIKAKTALHEKELEILISKIPFTDIKTHNGSEVYKYSTCNILIGYKSKKMPKKITSMYPNDIFIIDYEIYVSKRYLSLRFTHRIRLNKQTIIKNNTLKELPEYTAQSLTKNKIHYSQSKFEF